MSTQVLARKWRPRRFADLTGQAHVVTALSNGLAQQRLHHAYLLTGTRGVGKTTLARILAKSLNCEQGIRAEACGVCSACQAIDANAFPDVREVDAASRTRVEDTRELLENLHYAPIQGRFSVYIIDEVHMLSTHSFNALLKTLEEPPEHVKFILATTDPQKLPPTVLSRCLQFQLHHLTVTQIQHRLEHILQQETLKVDTAACQRLATAANGSLRDALSLLDQALAYADGTLTIESVDAMLGYAAESLLDDLIRALADQDGAAVLAQVAAIRATVDDFQQVLAQLLSCFHQLSVVKLLPEQAARYPIAQRLAQTLPKLTPEALQLYYQIALIGRRDLLLEANPATGFEMLMLRMLCFTLAAPATDSLTALTSTVEKKKPPTETSAPSASLNTAPAAPDFDWETLCPALPLSGFTKALASHCALKTYDGRRLVLALSPTQTPLLNAKQQQRLQIALQEHLGHPLELDIVVELCDQKTPAEHSAQQAKARQQAAEQSLIENANVKQLLETFDGKLIASSIRAREPHD